MAKSKSPTRAPMLNSSAEPRPENIFLFIPNLIGIAPQSISYLEIPH